MEIGGHGQDMGGFDTDGTGCSAEVRDDQNDNLWNKFCDIRAEFESTGAGIVLIDSETSENLHCKIDKEFPWYNDLYKIWGSNPSFSAKMSLSKLGTDHAGDLFTLTRPAGGSREPPAGSSDAHLWLSVSIPNPAAGRYIHPPPSVGGSSTDSPIQTGYTPLPPQFNHPHYP
ncbi:hypothetical protein F4604DRAFT_1932296 [Suillus subluteus]|nr:hypothetical protein F4604DRAFT_1932296 [Suillus subluteus]